MLSLSLSLSTLLAWAMLASSQFITDPGVYGPPLEVVHAYYDEWPTGITVSSTGRKFSNYPGGLDSNDTNTGTTFRYTVAELTSIDTETPYPSMEINNPPGGAINFTTYPPTGANYQNYLIGVQSVVLDPLDRLWILDTGRVLTSNGTLVPASYGGPKLVGVNITTNKVIQTIVFPTTVAYSDSYLNDVRFDLRSDLSGTSGGGVAYITDSSSEGRNGIIVVDLGNGSSWRHLDGSPLVRAARQVNGFVWASSLYYMQQPGAPYSYPPLGSDGIALSADGETLFWGPIASRYLYTAPTSLLRSQSPTSELLLQAAVSSTTEKGLSDGLETDTNGFIYHGNFEQNSVGFYNPANGTDQIFVRDPRINWVDTFSTGSDGYLYFTVNQLMFTQSFFPGKDRRVRPFALFRAPLPNNGTRVLLKKRLGEQIDI